MCGNSKIKKLLFFLQGSQRKRIPEKITRIFCKSVKSVFTSGKNWFLDGQNIEFGERLTHFSHFCKKCFFFLISGILFRWDACFFFFFDFRTKIKHFSVIFVFIFFFKKKKTLFLVGGGRICGWAAAGRLQAGGWAGRLLGGCGRLGGCRKLRGHHSKNMLLDVCFGCFDSLP